MIDRGVPDKPIANKPTLDPHNRDVWEAFWTLHISRPVGMDVGAIPLAEIVTYWRDVMGVADPDHRNELIDLTRIMDVAFLTWHRETQKQKG